MNDALLAPRAMIIWTATSTFSPPRSPRTLEGILNWRMAHSKTSITVSARLLVLARKPVTLSRFYIR